MNINALKLCLVTDIQNQPFELYQSLIIKAIQGGVTSVQLRMKASTSNEVLSTGRALKSVLDKYHIPLIINDDAVIAKILGAHLHIGPNDISPQHARDMVGPDAFIGLSIESKEELIRANELTCINYVAASAVFPSKTKPECKKIWGTSGLAKIAELSVHPMMGIGGIEADNVSSVIESGACGVAVVGAIHRAVDPAAAATRLIEIINQSLEKRDNHV